MQKNVYFKHSMKLAAAAAMSILLAACGGGGDGGTTSSTGSGSTGTGTTPQSQQPTDPYTGQAAAGTPTAQISGSVVNGPTTAATVTAYLLNPDGSNGASLGSAQTDASGSFTMTLTQVPTSMMRLVATGGTFTSEADASTQANESLELVAPYVTTSLSSFVITPLTHAASTQLTYLAGKQGKTLASAYTTASSAVLQLVTGVDSIAAANHAHGGVDYLSIVPGSAQDTLNAYGDALTAIEYYAVAHDLPSRVATRILALSSVTGTPSANDGNGQAINVGKWVGSSFDATQALTVVQMTPSGLPSTDMLAIVLAMNATAACTSGDHTGFYKRFPLAAGQTDYLDTTGCATYTNNLNAIKAKISANNRSKFVG